MNMRDIRSKKGFTSIELLVVIAIVIMLCSIIIVYLNDAKAKARDSMRTSELHEIQIALANYYLTNHSMPTNRNSCCGYFDTQPDFLQELVDAKLLSSNPVSPPGASYGYYDYGAGNSIGALLVVSLENTGLSTTGSQGTCRPWPAGTDWCDQSNNTYYCLCYPY